jgi:hypothetical protein
MTSHRTVYYDPDTNTIVTTDGRVWDLTGWFDADGAECDPASADYLTARNGAQVIEFWIGSAERMGGGATH